MASELPSRHRDASQPRGRWLPRRPRRLAGRARHSRTHRGPAPGFRRAVHVARDLPDQQAAVRRRAGRGVAARGGPARQVEPTAHRAQRGGPASLPHSAPSPWRADMRRKESHMMRRLHFATLISALTVSVASAQSQASVPRAIPLPDTAGANFPVTDTLTGNSGPRDYDFLIGTWRFTFQ